MKTKLLLIVFGIFLISFISAQNVSYCCEKTTDGAWCQNAPASNCDSDFRRTPSSCEATSFCRLGTCIDSLEGTCMDNTPQKVCEEEDGVWREGYAEDLPQCSLGCCLIGEQAAFVTQTRCKRLSSLYGLENNFQTSIQTEMQCIASATSSVKGACVFEKEYEKTCLFLTQKECADMSVANSSSVEFHKDYLCSAEELTTNCGPSKKTKCVEGRDEVYFIDTCGNLANIYDASKVNDKTYWAKVVSREESCGSGSSNANSATCGNCDYYLGSTCKDYETAKDRRPQYGDNICRDLSCEYEGEKYKHGETWCADSKGVDGNFPGSRYFRLICYNGEVSIEPCADFRQEICIQSDIEGFKAAACRVNQWQDCYSIGDERECVNKDRRDCKWVKSSWIPKPGDISLIIKGSGACVPEFTPGFDFWEEEGDAQSLCSLGYAECIVKFEKRLGGDRECVENCECLGESWQDSMNKICVSLGDCGESNNYLGLVGW